VDLRLGAQDQPVRLRSRARPRLTSGFDSPEQLCIFAFHTIQGRNRMTAINDVTDLSRDGEIAILTLNSPPVNALSAHVRDGLALGFRAAFADDAVKAIVLVCDGRTFIAGADISEFGKPPKGANLLEAMTEMENSPKPTIAAIHGTALGGGLEVALTC